MFLISVFVILYVFILGCKLYVFIFGELIRIWFLLGNFLFCLLFIKNVMCGYFFVLVICSCDKFLLESILLIIFFILIGLKVILVLMFGL